jgi:hypothetical protein
MELGGQAGLAPGVLLGEEWVNLLFDEVRGVWGMNGIENVAEAIAKADGWNWVAMDDGDRAKWNYIAATAIRALEPHINERRRFLVERLLNVDPHEAHRILQEDEAQTR